MPKLQHNAFKGGLIKYVSALKIKSNVTIHDAVQIQMLWKIISRFVKMKYCFPLILEMVCYSKFIQNMLIKKNKTVFKGNVFHKNSQPSKWTMKVTVRLG